jgi:transposase InsO family protein
MVLIWCSLDVVVAVKMDVTTSSTTSLPCNLTTLVGNLFHHHPTYSDEFIGRRMTEDYDIQLSGRQVKRIRLQQGWLRRYNNSTVAEAEQAITFNTIEQLLAEGRIRQYGRRQLIIHLSRKYGRRPRGNDVREALQALDAYGVTSRTPGMRKKRQDNYVVPGPNWLWCLDGHDKLSRFGIEIYACIDAFSRKIIWFFVGSSNRTQVSVLRQYLNTIKAIGYCPNFLRSDRGRETPIMADAHYFLYYTACFNDLSIPDDVFN